MNIAPATSATFAQAADLLRANMLVAFATETVYGLGANATSGNAVASIFSLKKRPQFNPLIIHVHDVDQARQLMQWSDRAEKLSQLFWPGPLTLVLKRRQDCPVSLLASAGGDTLGIRIPAHDAARALIAAAGLPIAAPSANRSGRVSPTTAQHVRDEFGDEIPLIVDAGACLVGIESTVVDISEDMPVLLRPGSITIEQLNEALKQNIRRAGEFGENYRSPGLLTSHYAPSLPVRLNILQPEPGEAFLAFGNQAPSSANTINLSMNANLQEAAANLFAALRALDKPNYTGIAVMPIPEEGLGLAINDRLQRAAAS